MSYREKLSALIAPDKAKDGEAILDELDETLNSYAKDIKELKTTLRTKDGVKPEDLAELEKENSDLKKRLTDTESASKKAARERDEAMKARAEIETSVNKATAESEVRKHLSSLGIVGDRLEELVEGYVPRATVRVIDGVRIAHIGDKTATEYFPEWAKTRGKEFIPAAANSGTGAMGSKGAGSGKAMNLSEFNAMEPKSRAEFMSSGGKLTE